MADSWSPRPFRARGVSPWATSLATILDLEDLCGYELVSAKKNAQTFAQVLQDASPTNQDVTLPSVFDKDTDISNMSDEEIEEAAKAESGNQAV